MRGAIVVISSPGQAYDHMAGAWLQSWKRQFRPDVALIFVEGNGKTETATTLSEGAIKLRVPVPECLIPGVLDKTLWYVRRVHQDGAWLFRTNLSSHVDVGRLCEEMDTLPADGILGFSPTFNHIGGAGMGLSPGAVQLLKDPGGRIDRTLIDDVAISGFLHRQSCPVRWTGRIDRVWPDGVGCMGRRPCHQYHVRVKTRDRADDAAVLSQLAAGGIGIAESWFSGQNHSPGHKTDSRPSRLCTDDGSHVLTIRACEPSDGRSTPETAGGS